MRPGKDVRLGGAAESSAGGAAGSTGGVLGTAGAGGSAGDASGAGGIAGTADAGDATAGVGHSRLVVRGGLAETGEMRRAKIRSGWFAMTALVTAGALGACSEDDGVGAGAAGRGGRAGAGGGGGGAARGGNAGAW